MQPDTTLPKEPKVKQYIGYLNQSGTSTVTEYIYVNTLGDDIIWTRDGVGEYSGNIDPLLLPAAKTSIVMAVGWNDNPGLVIATINADGQIKIYTVDMAGNQADGIMSKSSIEIRVFTTL